MAKNALEYKGHPLRRNDNLIYFCDMSDKYMVQTQSMDTKTVKYLEIATKISVQLQLTDP